MADTFESNDQSDTYLSFKMKLNKILVSKNLRVVFLLILFFFCEIQVFFLVLATLMIAFVSPSPIKMDMDELEDKKIAVLSNGSKQSIYENGLLSLK